MSISRIVAKESREINLKIKKSPNVYHKCRITINVKNFL